MDFIYQQELNQRLEKMHNRIYEFINKNVSNEEGWSCPVCYGINYLREEKNFIYLYALHRISKDATNRDCWKYLFEALEEYRERFEDNDWEWLMEVFNERIIKLKNQVKEITFTY